ncbi:DUF5708 family protein [Stackebrandtia nassauensis]|uniref:DUF5708 family protein n=1 Tax=Stackebrandtia nassauensis TaxID=283811 RepID=UPI0001A39346|nr:DUF5708 family protein [Stackebrandtia nassauensis]
MRRHLVSLGIGIVLAVVGLVLWLGFGHVETPVIGLRQTGIVLAVLGGAEAVLSLGMIMFPSTRDKDGAS